MDEKVLEKAHSRLSASGSHIWINCPGSVKLSESAPHQSPHPSAKEGTIAHKIAEDLLISTLQGKEFDVDWLLDTDIHDVTVTQEMIDGAKLMLNTVLNSFDDGDDVYIEERVDLKYINEEMFGTADVFIKHKNSSITVIDYKFGRIPVDPEENPQLMYYFLGARNQYPSIGGILKVVQPRSKDMDKVRSWQFTEDRFLHWEKIFKSASESARLGTPIVKGSWCKYCRAKPICKLH